MMLGGGSSASTPAQKDQPAAPVADTALMRQIEARYAADAILGTYVIRVGASAGLVTLYGTVATYAARESAEKMAMATAGVKAVDNRITVNYGQ
jgi:osmotically-inducible protein OsmY